MKYIVFFILSLLSIKVFSQQSALDSIAIKIQSYINQNKIDIASRSQEGSYVLANVNDSLYLDSAINFIREIEFDKSKLRDSFEYHLNYIMHPIADTAIIDLYQGWELNAAVFPNPGYQGEFAGGIKKHSENLFSYIRESGVSINSSSVVRVYFDRKRPHNACCVLSQDTSITRLVSDYYNTIGANKYSPPIKNGRPYFSSYLFKFYDFESTIYGDGYEEYDNLIVTDKFIYSLSEWKGSDSLEKILIFDQKKTLQEIINSEFLIQFEEEHHEIIRELIMGRGYVGGSDILKVNILNR